MLGNIVRVVLRGAIAELTHQAAGLVMILVAILIFVLAAGFGFLAFFLALSAVIAPWLAAVIVAFLIVLLGLVLFLAGRNQVRRRRTLAQAIENQLREELGKPSDGTSSGAYSFVLTAALIGVLLGHQLRK